MDAAKRKALAQRIVKMAVAIIAAVVVFWAGRVTSTVNAPHEHSDYAETTATVTEQSIGQSLTLAVSVDRPSRFLAPNQLSGILVWITDEPLVEQGQVLYQVGAEKVSAIVSKEPFWRTLDTGVKGPDVKALEDMLVSRKMLASADENYTWDTASAVKKWQAEIGVSVTGTVALGQIIAIPESGAALIIDSDTAYEGASLSGGERLFQTSAGEPRFSLIVTPAQSRQIPSGSQVRIPREKDEWVGVTGEVTEVPDGVSIALQGVDGGPLCGNSCDTLPNASQSQLLGEVLVVPEVTGMAVPVAALETKADGTTWVLLIDDGEPVSRQVRVVAVANGIAIIEGISTGQEVLIRNAKNESTG